MSVRVWRSNSRSQHDVTPSGSSDFYSSVSNTNLLNYTTEFYNTVAEPSQSIGVSSSFFNFFETLKNYKNHGVKDFLGNSFVAHEIENTPSMTCESKNKIAIRAALGEKDKRHKTTVRMKSITCRDVQSSNKKSDQGCQNKQHMAHSLLAKQGHKLPGLNDKETVEDASSMTTFNVSGNCPVETGNMFNVKGSNLDTRLSLESSSREKYSDLNVSVHKIADISRTAKTKLYHQNEAERIYRRINLKNKLGIINPNIQVVVDAPSVSYSNENVKAVVDLTFLRSNSDVRLTADPLRYQASPSRPSSIQTVGTCRSTEVEDFSEDWAKLKLEVNSREERTFSGLTLEQKKKAQLLAKERTRNGRNKLAPWKNDQDMTWKSSREFDKEDTEEGGGLIYDTITTRMPVIVPPSIRSKRNRKKSLCKLSSHSSSSPSSDSSLDIADIQRRQTNRLRKELPAPQPRRLCFKTNIGGCTHTEVKRAIESQSGATVVWMQYDPIQCHHRRNDFSCVWVFELLNDADVEPLIFEGFSLRGAAMNVRRVDDVYREECAAYTMCSQVYMEHKKRKLTRKSSARKRYFND